VTFSCAAFKVLRDLLPRCKAAWRADHPSPVLSWLRHFGWTRWPVFLETFFKTSDVNAKAFSRVVNTQGVTNEDEKVRQL
jgi:hypothetical protein